MDNRTPLEKDIQHSKTLKAGSDHYRAYVGPTQQYDFMGLTQIALLFRLGIREEHRILDVGCGSLRAGKFLIQLLLPGHYYGIEPNPRLWQEAIKFEIGEDVKNIKHPTMLDDSTFSFTKINESFDFIVAQSIFSHTASDIIDRPLDQAARSLKSNGQFLFTILDEHTRMFKQRQKSHKATGWIYPACVTYESYDILKRCEIAGLKVQRLEWYHPRQSWYRAVLSNDMLLSEAEIRFIGTGKPLFDERLET